ncbi:hypothetical protein KQX54_005474, partial [Cotesia glomerata]
SNVKGLRHPADIYSAGIEYTVEIVVALVLLLVVEGTGTAQRLLGELIRVHKRLFLSFRYGRVRYKFEKLFTKTQKREVEKTMLLARDGMKGEIEKEGIKRKESLSDSSSAKKKACWTQMQLAFHIPSAIPFTLHFKKRKNERKRERAVPRFQDSKSFGNLSWGERAIYPAQIIKLP